MNHEIEIVQFHEDQIEAISNGGGKAYVVIRRICENLGVAFQGQLTSLKRHHWAGITMIVIASPGGPQETACLPIDQLPSWMFNINVRKVAKDIRPKLELYQLEARDVLAAHFMPKQAEHPVMDELDMLVKCATELRDLKRDTDRRLKALENSDGHLAKIEQVEHKVEIALDLESKHTGRFLCIPWLQKRGWKLPSKIWGTIGKQCSKISREQFDDEPSEHERPEWQGIENVKTYLPEALESWVQQWGDKYPRSS